MKCSKCGHENDADAKFCEKCGSTLQSTVYNSGTSKTGGIKTSTKVLIAAVVILVAGLGLVIGLSVGNQNNNHLAVNATNNTTTTVNPENQSQSVQNTTTTKKSNSNNGTITATQAGNIAVKCAEEKFPGEKWSVNDVELNPYGIYVVELINDRAIEEAQKNPDAPLKTATSMDVYINTKTGAITSSPLG
jgi:hypothetical protein